MARGGTKKGVVRKLPGKAPAHQKRTYRIPLAYLEEATADIKEVLRKYREKCKTR